MTPKEKAIELFEKMAFSCRECDYESNAKQCALIAVDEIIKSTPQNPSKPLILMPHFMAFQYWEEVKQEIEAL
jgi:hypothetical protein